MNYEQRMKIIAAAIAAETAVTIDKNLEKGILDGFYRIDSIEKQEQKALDPLMPFHVERIQEGYGIWNSGGYESRDGLVNRSWQQDRMENVFGRFAIRKR